MQFELLAPAGSPEKMKFAFTYGADACFMGIPDFSLRTRLNGFNLNSLKACIDYAHSIDKKIYVTFNIFAHNQHIARFEELREEFREFLTGPSKPDAVIVADPGMMLAIHEVAPQMDIHVSTQANTLNYKAVEFWQKNGATRAILGREASLEDIRMIRKYCPDIEIECFVHGAMCMAYSGRCYLSRYFTGASANLGACAQPCRREYSYEGERINEDGEKEVILMEDEHGSYFFNSHDLCAIEYMQELMDAGVTSFKVEGRTKSIFYVSMVMKAYREVMDSITNGTYSPKQITYWKTELNKLINRGYSTGFMFDEAKQDPSLEWHSHEPSDYRFVGEYVEGGLVFVHNKICVGDDLEIIPIHGKNHTKKIKKILKNGEELQEFSAGNSESYVKVGFEGDEIYEPMTLIVKNYQK